MSHIRMTVWVAVVAILGQLLYGPMPAAFAQTARNAAPGDILKAVSINKATLEELQTVRGIGPALAERIISYREANGGFKSLDQLKEVRWIGDMKFERIKNQLTL